MRNGIQVSGLSVMKRKLNFNKTNLAIWVLLRILVFLIGRMYFSEISLFSYSFPLVLLSNYLDFTWITPSVGIQRKYPKLLRGKTVIAAPCDLLVSEVKEYI